jgi:hypothetical protein
VVLDLGMPHTQLLAPTLSLLEVSKSMLPDPFFDHVPDVFGSTVIPLQAAKLSGVDRDTLVYNSFTPLPVEGTLPLYVTNNETDYPSDACTPLPDDTPDLSQYVTLVHRGSCAFVRAASDPTQASG